MSAAALSSAQKAMERYTVQSPSLESLGRDIQQPEGAHSPLSYTPGTSTSSGAATSWTTGSLAAQHGAPLALNASTFGTVFKFGAPTSATIPRGEGA